MKPARPAPHPLPPGSTIGMLGGGQLGRMTALAAARLGYRLHVFCPDLDSPTSQVTDRTTLSGYDDREALAAFAAAVDVVTYEFENVPHDAVAFLAERVPVRPGPQALAVCQDRIAEKSYVNQRGIGTAPWRPVRRLADLAPALAEIGCPAVLKTARMGYDGKAQAVIRSAGEAEAAWHRIGARDDVHPAILEGFVPFAREVSVIAARGPDGHTVCYPAVENRHRDHILAETVVPAALPPALAARAQEMAAHLAEGLDLVGLLAVEMFHLDGPTPAGPGGDAGAGADGLLLVNELAPRPHNSGHWTLDACATDQFEQLVRAVCGLPLGSVARHFDAVMENLIGDDVHRWPELLTDRTARLHLYGKTEARPGRKMGHVTRLRPRG